jgi:hypothetical protein
MTQRSRSGTLRSDLGLDSHPFSCLGILAVKIGWPANSEKTANQAGSMLGQELSHGHENNRTSQFLLCGMWRDKPASPGGKTTP